MLLHFNHSMQLLHDIGLLFATRRFLAITIIFALVVEDGGRHGGVDVFQRLADVSALEVNSWEHG